MQGFSSTIYSTDDLIDSRYLVQEVKRGAMGAVYLSQDTVKNQPVAIKTFHDNQFKSQESQNRFLEEALMWIQMGKHPNIVQAYGLRLIDNKPYLMLERIMSQGRRGVTLKDLIFSEPIDAQFMIQIAIHICDGMIHALGVFPDFVHCDLKPENVLLGNDDIPKITDFGLTSQWKQTKRDSTVDFRKWSPQNLATLMEGTPAFSSPEQCQCLPLDTRSDIYSFGCILYNIAAKRIPFLKNEVSEYIQAHLEETPMPPSQLNSDLPDVFELFILRCMAKRPERRYATFQDARSSLIRMYKELFGVNAVSYTEGTGLTFDEYIERAWSFALVGNFEEAEANFREAGTIDPRRKDLNIQWGKYYFARKKYGQAIRYLENAIKDIPENGELQEMLGRTYCEQGRLEKAQFCFRTSIRLNPTRIQPYEELAEIYRATDQEERLEGLFEHGAKSCGYPSHLIQRLSSLYRRKGDIKKLTLLLHKAVANNPNDTSLQLQLARALLDTNNRRDALDIIRRISRSKPESFSAWSQLASLYIALNDYMKAADACKMALTLSEGDAEFYKNYALVRYHLRDYNEAWNCVVRSEDLGEDVEDLKSKIQAKRLGGRPW